jgi:hypothetical protein
MSLDDIRDAPDFTTQGARVFRVKEVVAAEGEPVFPLKEAFDKAKLSLPSFDEHVPGPLAPIADEYLELPADGGRGTS